MLVSQKAKVAFEEVDYYVKKAVLSFGAAVGVAFMLMVCVFIIAPALSYYFRSQEDPVDVTIATHSFGDKLWFSLFVGLQYAFS